jgi:hypothetical protein
MGSASADSISPMTRLGIFYFPYLVLLVLVPLMVRWRWGLVAALIMTLAEVALVVLVFYCCVCTACSPTILRASPRRRRWRERHAVAFFQLVASVILPALAALIGGALSVLWSLAVHAWRSSSGRRMRVQ